MNCAGVDRWLDEGSPAASQMEALAHARICARCLAALSAADALESLLSSVTAPAPAGFADRVMARVAATAQVRPLIPVSELMPFFQTVPWWVRVAREPASLLAMLLASVLVWQGDALFALATGGAAQVAAWLGRVLPASATPVPPVLPGADPLPVVWLEPAVLSAIVLGALPLAVMASQLLFRWGETLVRPRPH